MNHSYQHSSQQQQQQQSYSSGYSFQPQQQQHQQQYPFSRTLPSPSVSLSSDEYLVHRDYASGGSSTGQSRHGQSEQPSVEEMSPSPRSSSDSSLRFKATLDAQTAAMQHQGDTPSTYLNKGQFYTISIQDTEEYDGDIYSVVRIAFHEEAHRKLAARYWSFWLSQQSNPKAARALDIERASSTGMLEVQSKTFDRTLFKWNGKEGAKLMIRFNCLSTDFSRIKGVKGIPLRIQIETYDTNYGGGDHGGKGSGGGVGGFGGMDGGLLSRGRIIERSFAKIKLFRDKGAERKNKDDQKHLEKMWDKMRGKHADINPLSQVLAPVQLVSLFWECPEDEEDYSSNERSGSGSGSGSGSRRGSSDREGGEGLGDDEAMSSSSLDFFNQQQGESGGGPEYDDNQLLLQDGDSRGGGGKSKRRKMNDGRLDPGASLGYRGSGGAGFGGGGGELNLSGAGSMVSSSSSNSSVGGLAASIGHLTTTSNNNNNNNNNNAIDGGITPSSSSSDPIDRDPSYIPQQRKKKPMSVLCLYIKIGNEAVYRAIYLERPTLNELLHKLCEKLEIQASTVTAVFRKTTKKNLLVRADDAMVAQMPEELDMEVEYEFNQQDGSVNLTLKY
ncbi:CP2-domain-containing protein [Linnemannia elongata AG-77]|uniref:CP2-domain-containing protein n=1 Tax=Linnemannia elongata AG-77 TaxID=1314771 RepID=A0A197JPV9_9FUNG|nr:CP2-domain-containing protein [Linnemannia elongata AG-77]